MSGGVVGGDPKQLARLTDEERRTARLVRNGYWIDRLLEAYDAALASLENAERQKEAAIEFGADQEFEKLQAEAERDRYRDALLRVAAGVHDEEHDIAECSDIARAALAPA